MPAIVKAALVAALLVLGGCGDDDDAGTAAPDAERRALPSSSMSASDYEEGTILRVLHEDGRFGVFVALVEQRLGETFPRFFTARTWPNTLLAPTDDAFERLEPAIREALLTDRALLLTVMRYHVIGDGPIAVDDLDGRYFTPAGPVEATRRDGAVLVAGVEVRSTDIEVGGTNEGIIHLVEQVILPCDDPVVDRELEACTG